MRVQGITQCAQSDAEYLPSSVARACAGHHPARLMWLMRLQGITQQDSCGSYDGRASPSVAHPLAGHLMLPLSPCLQDIVDLRDGDSMVVLNRRSVARDQALPYDDQRLVMKALVLGESGNPEIISTPRQMLSEERELAFVAHANRSCRSTKLSMDTIIDDNKYKYFTRKTKIVCTAGPACWDETKIVYPVSANKISAVCPLSACQIKIVCAAGPACCGKVDT
eukprot:361554-Pelagomonas_calceolata.AAC.6